MLFFKLLFKEIYHFLKQKNGREFLKLAFWYGNKKRYTPQKVKALHYRLEVPDVLSWFWQFEEIFFQEFYKFSTKQQNKSRKINIIDCGANVGMSCLYFKKKYPNAQITAIEADEKIAYFLEKNLKNNLSAEHFAQIEIIKKAVWIHDEGVVFESEGADGGNILFTEKNKTEKNKNNVIKIPSMRLKNLLLAQTQEIDMLKIDIEGAETQVLTDCKDALHLVKNLFVEYHAYTHSAQTLHTILDILTENGFRYFIKNSLDKTSPFIQQKPKNDNGMDMQLNIFAYR